MMRQSSGIPVHPTREEQQGWLLVSTLLGRSQEEATQGTGYEGSS